MFFCVVFLCGVRNFFKGGFVCVWVGEGVEVMWFDRDFGGGCSVCASAVVFTASVELAGDWVGRGSPRVVPGGGSGMLSSSRYCCVRSWFPLWS